MRISALTIILKQGEGRMSTWLKLLPLRLTEISKEELIEPDLEVDPSADHVVGKMSDDSKKFYFLYFMDLL